MIATTRTLAALRERWLKRRDELRRLHALVDGAVLCDELLTELDGLAQDTAREPLSLKGASLESGYSVDHLGRLLREGRLRNAGRPHSPRICRGDLPAKARPAVASRPEQPYDPHADARSLVSRLRHGGDNGNTK